MQTREDNKYGKTVNAERIKYDKILAYKSVGLLYKKYGKNRGAYLS